MGSRIYLLLTLGLYTVGVFHVLVQALARKRVLASSTIAATLLGFALHTAYLSQRWTEAGHFPVVGLHDAASFMAWATVLVYLLTYVTTRVDALGLLVHPVAFGLLLTASLAPMSEREDPILKSLFLPIHTTLAFFGYAALFVAFGMGLLYLVQERGLKSRTPNRFYYLAPSLERCDTISGRSVAVGFGFLTLAIVTGVLWSHSARGRYWSWNAKELSALTAWVIYVVLLLARRRSGWGGRQAAWLGVAGFSVVLFTLLWMNVIQPAGAPAP
jgi:cytochrome c-type biogenesis protein CcsB